jgi:hypothetical protein
MLVLALATGLALAAPAASDVPAQARFYYGLPGSEDYVIGTVSAGAPTDVWAQHSLLPQMLMDNAATANATHVYALSGYNASNPRMLASLANGATTWEAKAQPPIEMSNSGAAIVGDTLYYCSGYSYGTGATLDTVLKYSITNNSWTAGPGPFTGTTYNWQPFVLACAGKVYYISGCNQPGATNPTRQVWAYTPGAGWAQVADMNQGRVFAAGWVYNDTIWMAGGYQNTTVLNHTEFYDPVANVWTVDNSRFPTLPYGVWAPASGVVGDIGFIAGGVTASMELTDSIVYFNHTTQTWSVERPLALKVYRTAGAASGDGKAFVIGGSTGGFTPTNVVQFEQMGVPNTDDVGVQAILAPPPSMMQGAVAPKAQIRNFGTDPQSSIPVYCRIDSAGTNVYAQNLTHPGPLAPGATADVTFPNWSSGPAGNSYQVTMFTALAGDQNPGNDTMMRMTVISGGGPEDTIHVDGPYSENAVGLTSGGTFYTAARLTPTMNCNVIAVIFYHHQASQDQYTFVWEQNTVSNPGPVVESIPYTGATTMWVRSNLASPYYVSAGDDVWVGPRYTHGAGEFPGGVDAGPAVAQRGGFINYDGTWTELRLVGLNFNWNIRAIVQYEGGVEEQVLEPTRFEFLGSAPIPVRDFANIRYSLAQDARVNLSIYDASGSRVRTLVDGIVERGERTASWNRRDDSGRSVANGTYFYRLTVDGRTVSAKSVVLD